MIETILLGLLLMVPIIWLLGVLGETHRAVLAATAAAREGGFEAARLDDDKLSNDAVDRLVTAAFLNHGLNPRNARVRYSTTGTETYRSVEIKVSFRQPVFRAPLLGSLTTPAIPIEATHVARVDPYRSRP